MKFLNVFVVLLCTCFMSNVAVASSLDDTHTPISFKIEMLNWEEANKVVPNKAKFTIIDVETGLQFRVQRRAGRRHADVQPLTREDTKIMKKIYNGTWSWKRRAVIVVVKDQVIAASMHGMPHGAGALQNGFPGHFCVHFSGSTTHRSNKEDLSHKLMIIKAAGKLEQYLQTVTPYELINIFITAVNQGDIKIIELLIVQPEHVKLFKDSIKNIEYVRMHTIPSSHADIHKLMLVDVPINVSVYRKGKRKENKVFHFMIRRNTLTDRWYIDGEALRKDLQ